MKRISLISFAVLACLTLSACGTNTKQAKQDSEASSLKIANSKLKKKVHKHSVKKTHNKNSSYTVNSASQQGTHQAQNNSSKVQNSNTGINNANDAVAAARAKYGDDNGYVHWGYMIDGETGQPVRNADGSYFVKGTADDGTMTGTQYSVNVFPDGTITSN